MAQHKVIRLEGIKGVSRSQTKKRGKSMAKKRGRKKGVRGLGKISFNTNELMDKAQSALFTFLGALGLTMVDNKVINPMVKEWAPDTPTLSNTALTLAATTFLIDMAGQAMNLEKERWFQDALMGGYLFSMVRLANQFMPDNYAIGKGVGKGVGKVGQLPYYQPKMYFDPNTQQTYIQGISQDTQNLLDDLDKDNSVFQKVGKVSTGDEAKWNTVGQTAQTADSAWNF